MPQSHKAKYRGHSRFSEKVRSSIIDSYTNVGWIQRIWTLRFKHRLQLQIIFSAPWLSVIFAAIVRLNWKLKRFKKLVSKSNLGAGTFNLIRKECVEEQDFRFTLFNVTSGMNGLVSKFIKIRISRLTFIFSTANQATLYVKKLSR